MKPLFTHYELSIPKTIGFLILWGLVVPVLMVAEWVVRRWRGDDSKN